MPFRLLLCWLCLMLPLPALAHFGLVIPSDDLVETEDPRDLTVAIRFLHPFDGIAMDMARPQRFGVMHRGQKTDLLDRLQEQPQSPTQRGWQAHYEIRRPGDHTFYVEPAPYWESAENCFIIHYTKVCVAALGLEDSWDQPLGLETEIVPMTRPYGLWTGNLFSGQVLLHGQPVPHAEIEVEYLNERQPAVVAPAQAYITQVIRADANGVFNYAMPRAGWWGFAALSTAPWSLPHDGVDAPVEIGAVFWVRTRDMAP